MREDRKGMSGMAVAVGLLVMVVGGLTGGCATLGTGGVMNGGTPSTPVTQGTNEATEVGTSIAPTKSGTGVGTGVAPTENGAETRNAPTGTATGAVTANAGTVGPVVVTPCGGKLDCAPQATVEMPSIGRTEPGTPGATRDLNQTPTPVMSQGAGTTITLENAAAGVTIRVGEQFLVALGDGEWKVEIEDPTVVQLMLGAPAGTQGYFEGMKVGTTNLIATSDPPCRKATPPCGMPTREVRIPVTVTEQ